MVKLLSGGWKVVAAFALVAASAMLTEGTAEAGLFRGRTVIVESRAYYVPLPTATVSGVPVGTVVAAPVETTYATQVITPAAAPVPATYVAPTVVVEPVVPAGYVVPARRVFPRRVYYVLP